MLVLKDTKGVEIMIRHIDFEKVPVVDAVNEILVDSAKQGASDMYGDHNPTKSTLRLYDNRGWVLESGVCNYDCYSDKINKISITSNKSWGENYPAGADLAPLFTVEFSSLAEYVKQGFTGEISRYFSICSGEAKDRREVLICAESSFVLKGLSPGMSKR